MSSQSSISLISSSIWKSFAASIDMLSNIIKSCPDNFWSSNKKFYFISYHTAVFLDYYLSIPPKNFQAQLKYTLTDFDKLPEHAIDDIVPDKHYSKTELVEYIAASREKLKSLLKKLEEQQLHEPWLVEGDDIDRTLSGRDAMGYTVFEILLYNLRHVQHHVGQLNWILRKEGVELPDYVTQSVDSLQQ